LKTLCRFSNQKPVTERIQTDPLFLQFVFSGTCASKKPICPPIFPQKNGETGPQAGIKMSKATQRSGRLTG